MNVIWFLSVPLSVDLHWLSRFLYLYIRALHLAACRLSGGGTTNVAGGSDLWEHSPPVELRRMIQRPLCCNFKPEFCVRARLSSILACAFLQLGHEYLNLETAAYFVTVVSGLRCLPHHAPVEAWLSHPPTHNDLTVHAFGRPRHSLKRVLRNWDMASVRVLPIVTWGKATPCRSRKGVESKHDGVTVPLVD